VNVLGHEPEPVPAFDPDAAQFFEAIRLRASGVIQAEAFATWWRPARGWHWEDSGPPEKVLVIALPSPQFVCWWRALYMGWLATFARELGREGLRFRFVVVDEETATPHDGSIR
jgi:hypothetical protein